jgi:3-oxoacyl-[acyl-carrier protein] reductase|tara:strand:- start:2504 stop:3271 length:768 start_codon:yes stop_codon:yes gene_type:complete
MDLGIKNKRVLISGASNGIGKELAFQFAKEGCKLTLIARNKLKLKSITKKIGGKKKGHHFFDVNLLPTGSGTEISKKILKKLGAHEIIVHCVGGGLGVDDPFAKYTDWLKVWRFNVGIAIEINNIFVKALMKKKWGRVIHISSILATHGEAHTNKVAYASSKAYLNSYLKGLSQLIAHKKIIFSGVMPGPLLTKGKFWEQQSKKNPSKVKKYLENNFAIRRFGKENEICPFILLLASKHASYASGTIIPIDGGKY